jgi:SNF2 family DNA or RNA helicase
MKVGNWVWSEEHSQSCQVIEAQTLWGNTTYRVWLPTQDVVVRLSSTQLKPLSAAQPPSADQITYIATAARIADALTQDVLLAPIESSVIPLPHQIKALSRAVAGDRIRYLLADEVGLGKTIEAGLVMRELKLRGLVQRILVVAPKGLVSQWVSEMALHFSETFHLVLPEDLGTLKRMAGGESEETENPWRVFDQVVCPMDSVKPMDGRKGWSVEQVASYNRDRFDGLISAGWDLIVVDEAHRLGGSTEQVARYRLGQGLAEAAPYLLLLSATPHQGKTDAFHRLMALLDPMAFPDISSISQGQVRPYVIRTEKRRAIDAHGEPLFQPRQTQLVPVAWSTKNRDQKRLYDSVTDYVRDGYNQAMQQKKTYVGFLLILMQRLVTSSTRAIRTTLERRLAALREPEEQLSLFPAFAVNDDWVDLDGQEQVDAILSTRLKALKNEKAEVELLLELARRTEAAGADAKAEALLDWIYCLQQEETNPDLKVLIFTEFVPTQEMLRDFLGDRGMSVVCLNGSMGLEERKQVQKAFSENTQILISTDAGGEGLNLQFCHVIVNYDIPWNPMRLEQRIGRVDRIGQAYPVKALNLVLEDTVEFRVREVLEEKLAVILKEFGIDKTGDVLDSAEASELFDDLYVETLLNPDALTTRLEAVVSEVITQAQAAKDMEAVYQDDAPLDPAVAQAVLDHPIPHWVERMTVAYLRANGGQAECAGGAWQLTWPTGDRQYNVTFTPQFAPEVAISLNLESPQIRGLTLRLPALLPGHPIPQVTIPDLPATIQGVWSLWKIALAGPDGQRQHFMPLFISHTGKTFLPTARHIWEQLLTQDLQVLGTLSSQTSSEAFQVSWQAAEHQGQEFYETLLADYTTHLQQERQKGEYAFASRRQAIERIGLAQVRDHRLKQLAQEEAEWLAKIENATEVQPELSPLLLLSLGDGVAA